ncbi:probable RNA polymerase II nuclear localization protein SLC7A6OS [Condylostylus longicornis]|uniref:probable RNA polymerase II nuclear localization protein SLC7A6OS n=1 Tax=Condylostylus longicornis TaxID=2530218 RepID=UPI00244DF4F7|nr:probable RNA polymerase II nuclear localization protein SLC7A6OS [Condylostylus longicornis]
MSAVVRVKRRINEEPLTAFVLNCKKRKIENGEEINVGNVYELKEEVSTVLKFAGTVECQDEPVTSQINRITKDDAKILTSKQRKPLNQTEKMRQEMKDHMHESRFKIVNCYRAVKDSSDGNGEQGEITVVDIEKDMVPHNDRDKIKTDYNEQAPSTSFHRSSIAADNSNSLTNFNSENELPDNYVYDLYLPENDEQPAHFDHMDNYNISVGFIDNLVYEETFRDITENSDSDDSNCEDYYKNDYPDSEHDSLGSSIDEENMRKAVARCNINDEYSLSSDDEECKNGFVYSIDSEGIGFEDDLDYCDVNRYGEAYARYKARILKKNKSHDYDSDLSDSNYTSE